jgi:hypothetical protein
MSSETGTMRVSKTKHLEKSRIRFPDSGMRFFEALGVVRCSRVSPFLASFRRSEDLDSAGVGRTLLSVAPDLVLAVDLFFKVGRDY